MQNIFLSFGIASISEKQAKIVLKMLSAIAATLLLTTVIMQVALDISEDQ